MSEQPEVTAATEAPASETPAKVRGDRKTREGMVVSDKMEKTIVVELEDRVKHKLYGKVLRQTTRLKAHDEENAARVGDRVIVMETRPLSATKRWRLVTIVEKAQEPAGASAPANPRWGSAPDPEVLQQFHQASGKKRPEVPVRQPGDIR